MTTEGQSYKVAKVNFVSGATGSNVTHVNLLSLVALVSIALYSALRTRLLSRPLPFILEFTVLIVPLLLSLTTFAEAPVRLILLVLVPTSLLLILPARDVSEALPSSSSRPSSPTRPSSPFPSAQDFTLPPKPGIAHLPPLTTYRAHMMLMTILAILAVDFPIFPRPLAKCENFGVSIMDLGVGSFVYAQGIASARALVVDPKSLISPTVPKMLSALRRSAPIVLIGLARVLAVKGTEYPEHETEYGTHWNFFLTLAAVPVVQILLHPVMVQVPVALLGVAAACVHQLGLFVYTQDFVMHAPRQGMVGANKEGIVSLTGYLSIHIFGLSAGTLLLPSSPSTFRRIQHALAGRPYQQRQRGADDSDEDEENDNDNLAESVWSSTKRRRTDKAAIELLSYALLWWTLMGLCYIFDIGGGISRRLVNIQYIFWVVAFNSTFLCGYIFLDLFFHPAQASKRPRRVSTSPTISHSPYSSPSESRKGSLDVPATHYTFVDPAPPDSEAPPLLQAINKNGLVVFLLANVLTGLVNLALPTMYMGDAAAMAVLILYAAIVCGAAWGLRGRRIG